jgi:hypothetical protein
MKRLALILTVLFVFSFATYAPAASLPGFSGSTANIVINKMREAHAGGRYYYSLGGVSMRFDNTVVYPVQATLPSISVGCNGIDITGGGLSFMDEEHLAKIWDQMTDVNQWAAIGIGLGVKMLSNELASEIETLQDLTTALNNMQFDTCAAMTAGATFVTSSDYRQKVSDRANKAMDKVKEGYDKLFQDQEEEDETETDREKFIDNNSPQLSSIRYLKEGRSLLTYIFGEWLDNATSSSTKFKYPKDVNVDQLRALYGDVNLSIVKNSGKTGEDKDGNDKTRTEVIETFSIITPCDKTLKDYEDTFYYKGDDYKCLPSDEVSFNTIINASLTDYINFVTDTSKITIDNNTLVVSILEILSSYNISQLIIDSSWVGDKDFFIGTVEMCREISVTLVTYYHIDMFYEQFLKTLYALKNDVDTYGKEPGVTFSSYIASYIEQVKFLHDGYEKDRAAAYSIYAASLEAKRQETRSKFIESVNSNAFTATGLK